MTGTIQQGRVAFAVIKCTDIDNLQEEPEGFNRMPLAKFEVFFNL